MGITLVTGGLGFIGAPLCEALAERGRHVLCVDRLSGNYSPERGPGAAAALSRLPGVEVLIADVRSVERRDIDAVVHLAALPGVRTRRSPAELRRANVELTALLTERARCAGARLVLASSSSIYGNAALRPTPEHAAPAPLGAYGASKLAAERVALGAARERGADAVAARPFTVFGPGQRPDMAIARWTRALLDGQPLDWHAHPGGARELTYVDDAVRGIAAALEHGRAGEAYNIGGCASHRLEHVLALLEQLTGRSARRRETAPSPADAVATAACLAKSRRELGYRPRVLLEEGLRRQVEAALAHGLRPAVAA